MIALGAADVERVDGAPGVTSFSGDAATPIFQFDVELRQSLGRLLAEQVTNCGCCRPPSVETMPATSATGSTDEPLLGVTSLTVGNTDPANNDTDAVYGGTVGDSGNVMLEGLIWGQKWNNSAPIYYFFDDATSITNGSTAWTATEKAAYRAALQSWADVANLSFVEVFDSASANFIERKYVDAPGSLGNHQVPGGSQAIGNYNSSGYGWDATGLQPGGLGFATLVHELGHGLGLAHPHDTGGGSTIFPGVSAPFGSYGENNLNQNIYTIMSYNHGYEVAQGGLVSFNYGDAATPMPLDIAAMQFIYGANTTTNNGNNTYTLPTTNANGTFWKGIYDTGGTDEIVHNGATGATISLQSATVDNTATGGGSPSFVNGIRGGFTIAQSATIENATGGFGDDTIIGNSVANNLQGRDGADTLIGSGGGDQLFGGIGNDTLYGDATASGTSGVGDGSGLVTTVGTSNANAVNLTNTFSLASDSNILNSTINKHTTGRYTTPSSGALTAAYYSVTLNAGTVLRLDVDATTGTLDTWVQVRNAAGTLVAENDQSAGTDPGSSGDPNDSELAYTVTTTGTYFIALGEWNSATNAFRNTLPNSVSFDIHFSVIDPLAIGNFGTAGSDTLNGGAGTDAMYGGDGNDFYYVDNTGDSASETTVDVVTGGFDYVIATANFTLGANVEQLILEGAATQGTGTNTANVLYGLNSGQVLTLSGLDGDDVIYGSTVGGNTLLGGNGIDTLLGYGGNNTMSGGNGSDIYYTYTASDVLNEAGNDAGIDTVYATYSITVGEDFEQVLISGAATSITSNSLDDNNIFYGNSAAGAVTLNGGGGADVMFGGVNADALNGGAGVDLLFGNGGADQLAGGDDTDIYYLTSGTETTIETLTGGFDTAYSNAVGTTTLGTNVEQLILYGAATGGLGNSGVNYLYGHIASGAVTLDGAGGADYLLDNAASGDVLIGGAGDDQLDLRTGGNDVIRFAAGSGADRVFGFDSDATGGQDIIDVAGRGFSAGSIGTSIVIAASGADTLITIGADTIRLVGVAAATVNATDFAF